MIKLYYDIDGKIATIKPKPKKPLKKSAHYRTIMNHRIRKFEENLEEKLPNEFKGAIYNYNHLNNGEYGNIDGNEYNFY